MGRPRGFAVLMVGAGLRMLREPSDDGGACALPGGGVHWQTCLPKAIATGAVVGFLTGLFGVGGGFLIVPALVLLLGLAMTAAVSTSLVIVAVNAAAGFAAYAGHVSLDWGLTAAFAGSAVVGSLVAGRAATRVDADRLRRWFAYLVLALAVLVVVLLIVDPAAIEH